MDITTGSPWETVTLKTFALRPIFADLLEEARTLALREEEGKLVRSNEICSIKGKQLEIVGAESVSATMSSSSLSVNTSREIGSCKS